MSYLVFILANGFPGHMSLRVLVGALRSVGMESHLPEDHPSLSLVLGVHFSTDAPTLGMIILKTLTPDLQNLSARHPWRQRHPAVLLCLLPSPRVLLVSFNRELPSMTCLMAPAHLLLAKLATSRPYPNAV
jgi:hypothetical protein